MSDYARYMYAEGMAQEYFQKQVFDQCLSNKSEEEIINILCHRRYISNRFTLFCDTVYPLLENENAKAVAADIVRDEYANENHRNALVQELIMLGVEKQTLREFEYSESTNIAGENIEEFAHKCVQRGDLYSICTLRFFSEILAGVEFGFFLKKLFGNESGRKFSDSLFLNPHVDYDLGEEDCHSNRYLPFIVELFGDDESDELFGIATDAIYESVRVRSGFYEQFCPDMHVRIGDLAASVTSGMQ